MSELSNVRLSSEVEEENGPDNKRPRHSESDLVNEEKENEIECCICNESFPDRCVIPCSEPLLPHYICLNCVKSLEKSIPPSFPLTCPCCRAQYNEGLFRHMLLPSNLEDIQLSVTSLISRMRANHLNEAHEMSEFNYIAYITSLEYMCDLIEDEIRPLLPQCINKYLDLLDPPKLTNWMDMFTSCAKNLRLKMLLAPAPGPAPIDPDLFVNYQTSLPCEDIIIYIIFRQSGSRGLFNPNSMLQEYLTDAEISPSSLSRIDPRSEDDEEVDEEGDGAVEVVVESSFSDAVSNKMDDIDVECLWDMNDFFKTVTENGDFTYAYYDMSGQCHTYNHWMTVVRGKFIRDMIHMHPDIWFISC